MKRSRRNLIRLLAVALVICIASLAYMESGRRRVVWLEAECDAASKSEQWPRLENLAGQWVQHRPDLALPWLYAAEAASQQGDSIRTAYYLYHLPDSDARTPVALFELSHLQFGALNQPIAGAETCERILRLQPQASEAHRRLLFYYAMSRQRGKLIAEARRAIATGCDVPETYVYLIAADWITFTNGYDVNQRWLQSSPENETFLVAQAYHLVRSAALDEEAELVDESGISRPERLMNVLLERFPHNREVLAFQLNMASFRGKVDRVAKLLAQAPPSSTEDSRFWRFKGWMHETRHELEEAEKAYLQ